MATITSVMARVQKASLATSLRAMTMISEDRMKSVRMAPDVMVPSASSPLMVAVASSASCPWPETFSQIFSAPSKHR